MYRTCIFCSADLGSNDVLEFFPVGRRLAFDARKGRLWAICRKCTRWNLAPIEERWEAVEEAEEKFRGSRLRAQSENIGMAKMPDGTELVRIGSALPVEFAAWRYGSQLVKRRAHLHMAVGAGLVTGGLIVVGLPLIAGVGLPLTMINPIMQVSAQMMRERAARRVVVKLPPEDSPTGNWLVLRRRHLNDAQLDYKGGWLGLSILDPRPLPWYRSHAYAGFDSEDRIMLTGQPAHMLASRAMVDYNSSGASQKDVANALRAIEEAGSPDAFIRRVGEASRVIIPPGPSLRRAERRARRARGERIGPRKIIGTFRGERLDVRPDGVKVGQRSAPRNFLPRTEALALEMALHEEAERRAMEGELAILEDAWREAEQIARIADALPDEPPEDLET